MSAVSIPSPEEIKSIRKHLRSLLPAEAFAATPLRALPMLLHVAIVIGCAVAIGRVPELWQRALLGVMAGHSMAVVSFYGHELSHGHIIRQRAVRTLLEYVVWTITLQPTVVWRETHNRGHHRNTNTLRDAFRSYAEPERSAARSLYSWLMIPSRANRGNLMILFAPTFLHLLHAMAALFAPRAKERTLVVGLGEYSDADRVRIVLEISLIGAFQVGLFYLCGGTWALYFWAGPVAMSVASLIGGAYTYSQHTLHPLGAHDNPFATTSLKLPRLIDRLHINLSHHTAHHLFDGVNADHLPQVSQLLRTHYPHVLDERGLLECWRAVYHNPFYKRSPEAPSHASPDAPTVALAAE